MRNSTVGILLGAFLGYVLVVADFSDMLVVAFFALIGWVAARIVAGDLDLAEFFNRNDRSAGPARR
jgi:hypothetical protein